jgi:alkylated DNA repair dioxygenase AlkB
MANAHQLGLGLGTEHASFDSDRIVLPDADLEFFPQLFTNAESDRFLELLLSEIPWEQDSIVYYGKRHNLPRLTCWFGDPGTRYTYSNIAKDPRPWTPPLRDVRKRVEAASRHHFNSVLLNLYRSGEDAVSWHQDDEPELGESPTIASLSFGSNRVFQMRHVLRVELPRKDIVLSHGSLLIMRGQTQQCWKHQIPRTMKPVGPRVNLTFRHILRREIEE